MNSANQKGSILIFFALFFVILLAFSALTINAGYYFVVRNQLQNAADAGALAGTGYLFPADASGQPQWVLAQSNAARVVSLNTADGIFLTNSIIETGYWDLSGTAGFRSLTSPGPSDAPAIKVTINKTAGQNGGPLNIFFGTFLGVPTMDVTVSAIAAIGFTNQVPISTLFPIAIPLSLYSTYWNGSAKIDPATGQPYVFQISGSGTLGQWTSFNINSNDSGTLTNFIINGNPISYKVGDMIYLAPGAKASLYSSVPANIDVVIPVVSSTTSTSTPTIIGFGSIHIDFAVGGSGKYVQVHFNSSYKVTVGDIGGTNFGVHLPPRLVK